jgi:excisionase family DNA binding protein
MERQDKPNWKPTADAYLTVAEVAKILAISTPCVILAAIHAGELGAVNIARPGAKRATWRISPEDLEKFLERRRAVPPPKIVPRRRRRLDPDVTKYF